MEDLEEIRRLIDDIKHRNLLVVVEGKKDVRALNSLGITNIISLKKPLFAVVEEIASVAGEVVILTDLDSEGRKLYHELFVNLQKHGVRVDNRLRDLLFKTELRQVEGLSSYLG